MPLSALTRSLLARGESREVDYKQSIGQEFNDILVAFANSDRGGYCLLGVADDRDASGRHIGRVVGIEVSDRTRGQIQSRADATIEPIEIELVPEVDDATGKHIYRVHIPPGRHKPYCTKGGRYLIRRDGQNTAITPAMMASVIGSRLASAPTASPILRLEFAAPPIIAPAISVGADRRWLLDDARRQFGLRVTVTNVGNAVAQNIVIDADATAATTDRSYPAHTPAFVDYLVPTGSGESTVERSLHFDRVAVLEMIGDFRKQRREAWQGMAFMPTRDELRDKTLWPSPLLKVRAFYSDVHGQTYRAEIGGFFHLWADTEAGHVAVYLLKSDGEWFDGSRRVDADQRTRLVDGVRHLRYQAFSGELHEPGDLVIIAPSPAAESGEDE